MVSVVPSEQFALYWQVTSSTGIDHSMSVISTVDLPFQLAQFLTLSSGISRPIAPHYRRRQ